MSADDQEAAMTVSPTQDARDALVARLRDLGVKRVLVEMARNGQILELKCEMPTCYCDHPDRRRHFDPWPDPGSAPENRWSPNPDHFPNLRKDGGERKPWNIRLAHVLCNNLDIGWRRRIRRLLEKDPTRSFADIAEVLNRKKRVQVPPGFESWTAEIVRNVYVSLPLPRPSAEPE